MRSRNPSLRGDVARSRQRIRIAAPNSNTRRTCECSAKLLDGHEELDVARRRGIELRARTAGHGAPTDVERECIEAVYALEKCKGTRANYTWRMLRDRGIIPAVDHIVQQRKESAGYHALVAMGLQRFTFEAVVLRHPTAFSAEAVAHSRERLGTEWRDS